MCCNAKGGLVVSGPLSHILMQRSKDGKREVLTLHCLYLRRCTGIYVCKVST